MRAMKAPVEPTLWWYFTRAALVRAWVQTSTATQTAPEQQGEQIGLAAAEKRGDLDVPEQSVGEAGGDVPEAVRERRDLLVAQHQQGAAAEDEHPGQGDDEGRDAEVGDPVALPGADDGADAEDQQHTQPDRQAHVAR